mmetsp:Transcript_5949/g.20274  ORF Transcript_5949/g.20274 Transcript_5949/m.20274 type:complete len:308 (+) Transcript_5949:991-1914(+)
MQRPAGSAGRRNSIIGAGAREGGFEPVDKFPFPDHPHTIRATLFQHTCTPIPPLTYFQVQALLRSPRTPSNALEVLSKILHLDIRARGVPVGRSGVGPPLVVLVDTQAPLDIPVVGGNDALVLSELPVEGGAGHEADLARDALHVDVIHTDAIVRVLQVPLGVVEHENHRAEHDACEVASGAPVLLPLLAVRVEERPQRDARQVQHKRRKHPEPIGRPVVTDGAHFLDVKDHEAHILVHAADDALCHDEADVRRRGAVCCCAEHEEREVTDALVNLLHMELLVVRLDLHPHVEVLSELLPVPTADLQ